MEQDTVESQQVIKSLEQTQEPLLRWLAEPKVTNAKEQKDAENLLIAARGAFKEAEDKRKELTRPLDESKSRIIALFKPYLDRLATGITSLNAVLGKYHQQLAIQAEAARLTQLAEEAARIKAAGEDGEVLEPLAVPIDASVAKTSRADLGTVTYRDDYDIQVVNPSQVPRDLCEPSMTMIRARVKSGVLNIPGVLISKKVVSTARGAR